MSPLDVLSVMQDGIADYTESGHEGLASDMTEAHNAVAELIEASRALQDAMDENDSNKFDIGPATRFLAADKRHRAALARCTGAQA